MTTATVRNPNQRQAKLVYGTSKITVGFTFDRASTSGEDYIKLFGIDGGSLELNRVKGEPKILVNDGTSESVKVQISKSDYEKLRNQIKKSPIEVRR
jgi:hypothetical protein